MCEDLEEIVVRKIVLLLLQIYPHRTRVEAGLRGLHLKGFSPRLKRDSAANGRCATNSSLHLGADQLSGEFRAAAPIRSALTS